MCNAVVDITVKPFFQGYTRTAFEQDCQMIQRSFDSYTSVFSPLVMAS